MKKICVKCEIQQSHCFQCEYENENELDLFKCTKCMDKFILYNGKCVDCYYFLSGCKDCHFEGDHPVCDECYSNYNMTENKTCSQNKIYSCGYGYFLQNESFCILCPENCQNCHYDKEKEEVICESYYCSEWEMKNETYSCTKYYLKQALVEDIDTNIKYCYDQKNKLVHCIEGTMKVPVPKDDPLYRQNLFQYPPDLL